MKKEFLAIFGAALGLGLMASPTFAADGAVDPASVPAECSFELNADDTMRFLIPQGQENGISTNENGQMTMTLEKAKCATAKVTLHNVGSVPKESMGHNWVLVKSPDYMAIATEVTTGQVTSETDYLKPNDTRLIAHTSLSGPGESHDVAFSTEALEVGGDYTFFCNFPGHFATMTGKMVVK